jgi:hypothetical protein
MTKITEVLTSSSYTLSEKMEAYQEALKVSNVDLRDAIKSTVGVSFENLKEKFSNGGKRTDDQVIKLLKKLESLGIGISEMNDLYGSFDKIAGSAELSRVFQNAEDYNDFMDQVLDQAATTGNIVQSITDVYKKEAKEVLGTSNEIANGLSDILTITGNIVLESTDQISQGITSFKSRADNVFETAAK